MTRMQQRRGTAAAWTSANSVLGAGEIGYETDTGKLKIGDGATAWTSLLYFNMNTTGDTYAALIAGLSGKVHRWQFSETSGTTAADSIGSLNITMTTPSLNISSGTAAGAAAQVSGWTTSGLGSLPTGANARTFIQVARTTNYTDAGWSYGATSTRNFFGFTLNQGGGANGALLYPWSDDLTAATADVNDGYHLFAAQYDGSRTLRIYCDGMLYAKVTGASLNTSASGNFNFSGAIEIADLIVTNNYVSRAYLDRIWRSL